ncbi:MAG: nucleotidyltransferase family protein [Candidatus Omnitrophota bacterium]
MKALILAAGYATRLYPITRDYPKPLLKVKRKPIIDYIVDKLDQIDKISEIFVITNSKFIPFFRRWSKNLPVSKRLSLVDDLTKDNSSRLGAIGDIDFAVTKKKIKDDILVIGGDNLFDSGLQEFLSFAMAHKLSPVIGAFDIKSKGKAGHFGVVKLGPDNRIIYFKEKPKDAKSSLVAMCLYYFPKERLAMIKEYLRQKKYKKDATGLYIDWLRKKIPVYGFVFGGRWFDIGDHKFYGRARESFSHTI